MLFYENGELSLTRCLAAAGWIAFILVTAYLIYERQTWSHYDTFASLTGGGGTAAQIANKFINSKYNSSPGSYKEAMK